MSMRERFFVRSIGRINFVAGAVILALGVGVVIKGEFLFSSGWVLLREP